MSRDGVDRPLRILVVDDHDIVREGLAALLNRQPGYEVVAQAGTAADALTATDQFQPSR
jgi:DNA-binding NarL/FixJ family response regulator